MMSDGKDAPSPEQPAAGRPAASKPRRQSERDARSVQVSDGARGRLVKLTALGPGLTHPGAAVEALSLVTEQEFRDLMVRLWKGGRSPATASPGSPGAPAPPRPGSGSDGKDAPSPEQPAAGRPAASKPRRQSERDARSVQVSDGARGRLVKLTALGPGLTHPGAAVEALSLVTEQEFRDLMVRLWKGGRSPATASPGSPGAPAPPRPGSGQGRS